MLKCEPTQRKEPMPECEPTRPEQPVKRADQLTAQGVISDASPAGEASAHSMSARHDDQRFIDDIINNPAIAHGRDLFRLFKIIKEGQLREQATEALEKVVSGNPTLSKELVTASEAELAARPTAPVRTAVVRALTAARCSVLSGSASYEELIKGMENLGLSRDEKWQIERGAIDFGDPASLAELKKKLPLPGAMQSFLGDGLYYKLFGGREERIKRIESQEELICALAERGALLDDVVILASHSAWIRDRILAGIRSYLSKQDANPLSDKSQKKLLDLFLAGNLSRGGVANVEEILVHSPRRHTIERELVKHFKMLADTYPLKEARDKGLVRLCMRLYHQPGCSQELIDLIVTAQNSWKLGRDLVDANVHTQRPASQGQVEEAITSDARDEAEDLKSGRGDNHVQLSQEMQVLKGVLEIVKQSDGENISLERGDKVAGWRIDHEGEVILVGEAHRDWRDSRGDISLLVLIKDKQTDSIKFNMTRRCDYRSYSNGSSGPGVEVDTINAILTRAELAARLREKTRSLEMVERLGQLVDSGIDAEQESVNREQFGGIVTYTLRAGTLSLVLTRRALPPVVGISDRFEYAGGLKSANPDDLARWYELRFAEDRLGLRLDFPIDWVVRNGMRPHDHGSDLDKQEAKKLFDRVDG